MKRILVSVFALGLSFGTIACGKKAEPAPAAEAKKEEPKKEEPKAEQPKAEEPKKEEPKAEAPKADLPAAKGMWRDIPNSAGYIADVPNDAVDNGPGGAAGFHKDDGSFQITLRELEGEEAQKTFEATKTEREQIMFKKWVKAEQTPDGWVLVYEMPKLDNDMNEVGVVTSFDVKRKIGAKVFSCSGGLDKADGIDASIAACQSVRAK